ncbi:hypothetical protein GCM10029964_070340 [Kibdelosporangium lantanae]
MTVPIWAWAAVLGAILAMLAVDLVAHRRAHVVGVREALAWSGVWVALGLAFGGVVWWVWGAEFAGQYFAGYVIEKSLAVDNVFVFAIIFGYFAVPGSTSTGCCSTASSARWCSARCSSSPARC